MTINETHDPKLKSWVESANDPGTDFPIQNLPLCTVYNRASEAYATACPIGDRLLDITRCAKGGLLPADIRVLMETNGGGATDLTTEPADRKSTRLNSSHRT